MKAVRWRLLLPLPLLVFTVLMVWWRGPDWHMVGKSFAFVRWWWVVVAIGLNLLSVVARAACWHTTIKQAMPKPRPGFVLVFSAFCVGLLANVVIPGRVGELARVAVLVRRLPHRRRAWGNLIGSVVAHRLFDLFPVVVLVVWVLFTAGLPRWAETSLGILLGISLGLLVFALFSARTHADGPVLDDLGPVRSLIAHTRAGLGVMRSPTPAAVAAGYQSLGWLCQLLAVWATMRAFEIHQPLSVAGLVLVLMNVATIFPLWPGNVGLLQAAIALPLRPYGVPYGKGFAFGLGLQAIEASVGVGIGLVFLAREGLSLATLREMPREAAAADAGEERRARAGVSG
ncbi:MAG TPA: lysylphosphatidylglycerol synthase transmembrane domain-containing protein [Gaiellaceae bacterium]|nr:lysylphosphatidylglycerol synthase transmembrane domain-containing protein [Gaiellaceae bacterium]